ncbi:MAG: tetratricopeptide repeat protein [Candidatus Cloacimonadaceae bacterium]
MHRNRLFPLIITVFLLLATGLNAAIGKGIQAIINAYEKGELSKANALLRTNQPENADERAAVIFYSAMLTTDAANAQNLLQLLVDTYPKSIYAQKAYYELGSLQLLDREYDKALNSFNQITHPDFADKHYWIANTYFQQGDYTKTIASANQFIRLTKSSPKLEDAHYLIANSYINQKQYNNAITTLKKLLSQPKLIEDEQYLRYRYGYAAELLGNKAEAVSQYRQGYELDRYSQLAYLIEDRLFEMRGTNGSSIDLSFLYPHTESPLPDIVLAEITGSGTNNGPIKPDTTKVSGIQQPVEVKNNELRGMYLQAGRFSNKINAVKLCERIITLGLNAVYYESTQFKDVSWVILVGPYQTQLAAVSSKTLLRDNEIDSFIIQR